MAKFFPDLLQFAEALVDHWVAFATGSIPAMLLGAWEHWKGRSLSWRAYVAVFLVFGFVAASFQTWRQERSASMISRSPAIVQQLQTYYVEAEQHRRVLLEAQATSDQDYEATKQDADKWAKNMGHWVTDNMGWAAYVRLIKVPQDKAALNGRSEREQELLLMTIIRDNLEQLLETPALDKH